MANSKGFSSVIGTTFMVLVMMFLGTSVFLWTLSQNTMYNEAVRARNQEEADRRSENVVALSGHYSVSGSNVTVTVVLKNAGSVAAELINLWVIDTNQSKYAYHPLSLNLNPGDIKPVAYTVTILDTSANNTFVSWFVTARGNTVPLERETEESVIVAQVAQGIGSLALDFNTFRYYLYESGTKLANYPDGIVSFNVPKGTEIAYGCRLTNLDPRKETITLNSHSVIWQPSVGTGVERLWYIVNVQPDGTINGTYSDITLAYGETKLLCFASKNDLGESGFERVKTPISIGIMPTFLLLHGSIGSHTYGQNIPFVSIYYS